MAERLGYGKVATKDRLELVLEKTGFRIESIEEVYSGEWLHNPMYTLPIEGEWFVHSLVRVSKSAISRNLAVTTLS